MEILKYNIEENYPFPSWTENYFFDNNNNLIYSLYMKEKDHYSINYYNIKTKINKYFNSKNVYNIILLDNSKNPKIISCTEEGEVILYNLLEKYVQCYNLFSNNKFSFIFILKINKKKILLFEDYDNFYIFDIKKRQIETKLNFKNAYDLLLVFLDENKFNFINSKFKYDNKQFSLFQKLKIINKNKKIEDRIIIKEIKTINDNGYEIIKQIIVNIFHFGENKIDVSEEIIEIANILKHMDIYSVNAYFKILRNNNFIFEILGKTYPPFEYEYLLFELYNIKTKKIADYGLPQEYDESHVYPLFVDYLLNGNNIFIITNKDDKKYIEIDENSFK